MARAGATASDGYAEQFGFGFVMFVDGCSADGRAGR